MTPQTAQDTLEESNSKMTHPVTLLIEQEVAFGSRFWVLSLCPVDVAVTEDPLLDVVRPPSTTDHV